MRKLAKGYYIAAAALLLWAAVDLYHFLAIGNGLIQHYEGQSIVQHLVENSLLQAVVKALLSALLLLVGWLRREKRNRPRALTAFSVRLGALLLCLFFVCAGLMTLCTAQYVFGEITTAGAGFASYVYEAGRMGYLLYENSEQEDPFRETFRQRPGAAEYAMNTAIARAGMGNSAPSYDAYPEPHLPGWLDLLRGSADYDTAVMMVDGDGNVLRQSGDFLYFGYVPERDWLAGSDTSTAYGWIALGDREDSRFAVLRTMYHGDSSLWDLVALRMTGYFEGSRFEPLAMDLLTRGAYYNALETAQPQEEPPLEGQPDASPPPDFGQSATTSGSGGSEAPAYTVSELDAMGLLEWDERFDDTASAQRALVTIYAMDPDMSLYEPAGPVVYRQTQWHDNLLALLGTMDYYAASDTDIYTGASQFDLWDTIVLQTATVRDWTAYDAGTAEALPEVEFTILTALRASPLRIAMGYLQTAYLIAFLAALLGFLLLRRSVNKRLIAPISAVQQSIDAGWALLPVSPGEARAWAEPLALTGRYRDALDMLSANKNEISRLNAALSYARTAEQARRQMTSNIAHELKTPLAVIHGYAEGLREHIAEDKRDRYLDVILSETERVDGMVLELLDLSRLEAGKVKLSRDRVSLAVLTRTIFDKLDMAVQAKQLQLHFAFSDDGVVTADESRIAQVIENFATNAIKYTPSGGQVTVTIQTGRDGTSFTIENESEPLPAEALDKVWDAFYRADTARSGGGTGLGLAIAKNIVELHGGRCAVRNTAQGVAFSFTI